MRTVKLLDVESDLRLLRHREDTPLNVKLVVNDAITVINGVTEFMSNVLNIIDNKHHKVNYDLYDLKGMDRLIRLNDKQLLDEIKQEIDNLERKF